MASMNNVIPIFFSKRADKNKWCVRFMAVKDKTFQRYFEAKFSKEDYMYYLHELMKDRRYR